jgi:hypothetical protein
MPPSLTIGVDGLRLVLLAFMTRWERGLRWTSYSGVAASLWGSIVVSDFSFTQPKFGLVGSQWFVVFAIAAAWSTIRASTGLLMHLRRPSLEDLMAQIVARAQVSREVRALFLLKVRDLDHDYRILVYRDVLWNCYLLPHYNIVDQEVKEYDDPRLKDYISSELGVAAKVIHLHYLRDGDLTSRKHSEFYRQDTAYSFSFYSVTFDEDVSALPPHLKAPSFVHNGRSYYWLTLAELEADENTRNRNIDVTRHIADRSHHFLSGAPDAFPGGLAGRTE